MGQVYYILYSSCLGFDWAVHFSCTFTCFTLMARLAQGQPSGRGEQGLCSSLLWQRLQVHKRTSNISNNSNLGEPNRNNNQHVFWEMSKHVNSKSQSLLSPSPMMDGWWANEGWLRLCKGKAQWRLSWRMPMIIFGCAVVWWCDMATMIRRPAIAIISYPCYADETFPSLTIS